MYDIESARLRDGDAAQDRSERVNELLNADRLGYGNGDPLVGDSYDEYPEQPADLTTVEARQFVTELFEHDLVDSINDAIQETTPATGDRLIVRDWRQAFERATELFGVETPDDADETEQRATDDRLAELTDAYPDDMVTPSNPLVVSALYGGFGLSTEEIADVFSDDDRDVRANQIRHVLRDAGLIRANEGEDSEPSHRLGGTSMSLRDTESPDSDGNSGVNVNSRAVARDPNVTVEQN